MLRGEQQFVIARQSKFDIRGYFAIALVVAILIWFDPANFDVWQADALRPAAVVGLVIFGREFLAFVRARGQLIVGGFDWIASYERFRWSPLSTRVTVEDKSRLLLKTEPTRSLYYRNLGFVDVFVTTWDGHELARARVDPKLLKDGYEDKFEEWKRLTTST